MTKDDHFYLRFTHTLSNKLCIASAFLDYLFTIELARG